MKTVISIVVPVYNVEKYLEQCLESIVKQTVPFDEVILVNDGSTDNSQKICERYVSKYGFFKLINQENKGPSAARNEGIEYAVGNYIMFVDADDYLRLDTVRILKEHLLELQYDAIFFDADIVFADNCSYVINENEYDRKDIQINNKIMKGIEYFDKCYPKNYVASACMAIYKRQLIEKEKIRFPEGMFYEDTYFSFVFTIKAECVKYISERLYQRRYRNESTMTSMYSPKKFKDHVKIGLLLWDEIVKNQEVWLSNYKELIVNFINDYFSMLIDKFQLCKKYEDRSDKEWMCCFRNIEERYLLIANKLCSKYESWDIVLLNKILHNLHFLYLQEINIDKEYIYGIILKIVEKQKIIYLDMLKGLSLNEKSLTVGIYGTGNHTEGLLAIFEKLIGKVACNLVFIDSSLDNERYRCRKIINYKKINRDFDLIIISSFLYEQEMINNVRSIDSRIPIYRFYENLKGDIFSDYKIFLECCGYETDIE